MRAGITRIDPKGSARASFSPRLRMTTQPFPGDIGISRLRAAYILDHSASNSPSNTFSSFARVIALCKPTVNRSEKHGLITPFWWRHRRCARGALTYNTILP